MRMKSYLETYDLWNITMEERSLETLISNPIIVQETSTFKRAFKQKQDYLGSFFKHKTKKRRGRSTFFLKKNCKLKKKSKEGGIFNPTGYFQTILNSLGLFLNRAYFQCAMLFSTMTSNNLSLMPHKFSLMN